jgi:hypothetical protein
VSYSTAFHEAAGLEEDVDETRIVGDKAKVDKNMGTKCTPMTHQWVATPGSDRMDGLKDRCGNCGVGRFDEARVYELEQFADSFTPAYPNETEVLADVREGHLRAYLRGENLLMPEELRAVIRAAIAARDGTASEFPTKRACEGTTADATGRIIRCALSYMGTMASTVARVYRTLRRGHSL